MKKITGLLGLGLALAIGAQGASAQAPARPDRPQAERGHAEHGKHGGQREARGEGRGLGHGWLLKGISLTPEQRQRIAALKPEHRDTTMRARMQEGRAARQRGDTAAMRAQRTQMRAEMEQRQAQHVAALRTILTDAQERQLDANLAEMRERRASGEGRGQGREDRGRQGRSGRRG